ncbi:MAG: hypothetical protein P4L41_06925 [Flavipsychrobacter sp.]|nr:hypothetical protein [Flavipsychrobacter sp.]
MTEFKANLKRVNISPTKYLNVINDRAKLLKYNKVQFANDGIHKLMIQDETGKYIYFGNCNYGDFIIYLFLEMLNTVPEGTADKKRNAYLARANNIKGNWKLNKYSKNNLAINLLW